LAALKRDLERHQIVKKQIRELEQTRLQSLAQAPAKGPNVMVLVLARVNGIGIETADLLVREVLSRTMRDRRAVARYAGFTGSPDESGAKRRGLIFGIDHMTMIDETAQDHRIRERDRDLDGARTLLGGRQDRECVTQAILIPRNAVDLDDEEWGLVDVKAVILLVGIDDRPHFGVAELHGLIDAVIVHDTSVDHEHAAVLGTRIDDPPRATALARTSSIHCGPAMR
jgi:hypothetical protein